MWIAEGREAGESINWSSEDVIDGLICDVAHAYACVTTDARSSSREEGSGPADETWSPCCNNEA